MKRLAAVLVLFCSIHPLALQAQELYRVTGKSTLLESLEVPISGAVERFDLDIDLSVIEAAPERLTLALPDGKVEVTRERYVAYAPDYVSWVGTVRSDAGGEGYVHLVYLGDHVAGIVNLADGSKYQISFDGYGGHQLVRIEGGAGSCGVGAEREAEPARPAPTVREPSRPGPGARSSDAVPLPKSGPYKIDLLALYADDFLSPPLTEQSAKDFIALSVSIANDIFVQSGVNAQYQLVHAGPVTGAQPSNDNPSSALAWLNTLPSEVQTLRNSYGADVVAFFTPLSWSSSFCGIANLMTANSKCNCHGLPSTTSFGDRAFSANRVGCGLNDLTLAHEIGHNYGMLHDNDVTTSPRFTYGYGFLFPPSTKAQATVMGCAGGTGDITGAVCNRIRRFSDNVLHQGVAIGDANHRNAVVANVQTPYFATFRPTNTNGVPTVKITSPARDTLVRRNVSVTFQATASDPEQGNLTSQIGWRVDGVAQATVGGTFTTSFSTRGEHLVTATVTDSSGKKAEWTVPILADNPPTANFTVSCTGRTCSFTDTSTDDHFIRSWRWNLGDGTTRTSRHVTHTYPTTGIFTVTLTVTDSVYQTALRQKSAISGCQSSGTTLCLQTKRFSVQVLQNGSPVSVTPYSHVTGFFWFGSSNNLEVGVKIVDNGTTWRLVHGALTSLAYTVSVKDEQSGVVKTYNRAASSGGVLCGGTDASAFAKLALVERGRATGLLAEPTAALDPKIHTCFPGSGYVCLGGRFKVEVKRSGLNQGGAALTADSAAFWFGASSVVDVPVKVLNGTSFNGKYWVFFGSMTDQSFQVVVTDTSTMAVKTYSSAGAYCGIADTAAF